MFRTSPRFTGAPNLEEGAEKGALTNAYLLGPGFHPSVVRWERFAQSSSGLRGYGSARIKLFLFFLFLPPSVPQWLGTDTGANNLNRKVTPKLTSE